MSRKIEAFTLGGIALISGLVALSDFLGILDNASWLATRVPTLTLLCLATVSVYLLIEKYNYLEKIKEKIDSGIVEILNQVNDTSENAIQSLNGVHVKVFPNNTELVRYSAEKLQQAKVGVDDLTWSHKLSLQQHLPAQKRAEESYQKSISEASKRLTYREIFIFSSPSRKDKLRKRIAENNEGYSCAYYEYSDAPPFQFMIIDSYEIIFAADVFPIKCAIAHPVLGKIFSSYFEEAWKNAKPLKLGSDLLWDELKKILPDISGISVESGTIRSSDDADNQ